MHGMNNLYDRLKNYSQSDSYPYHMPGHKRQKLTESLAAIADIDITEIYDFDNLADPVGILKEAQDRFASYMDVKKSYYLVNGSTVGILAAISAAVRKSGKLLIARNAHKSTYHAMCIRDIEPVYIYPEIIEDFNIFEAVKPEQVKDALDNNSDIDAVIIVSPTYEGRIADIKSIAEITHSYSIPLIVDEAHGAHLGFINGLEGYSDSACRCGADIVIQSLHKTIPAPTQTAVLHFNSDLVDVKRIEKYLHVYQTSSPSYPLMACMESAVDYMIAGGAERLQYMKAQFEKLVDDINSKCIYIEALPFVPYIQDVGKLVFSAKKAGMCGKLLSDYLREQYHLEFEMSVKDYCLAMFTVADNEDAYSRLLNALVETDRILESITHNSNEHKNKAVIPMYKAWEMEGAEVELSEAAGSVANTFVGLYPPGTPILVPGERITEEHIRELSNYEELGYEVTGIHNGMINIINDSLDE